MTVGTCDHCGHVKRLRSDGTIPAHYLSIAVSRRAVPTVGAGWVKRLCSGSGKQPRRAGP